MKSNLFLIVVVLVQCVAFLLVFQVEKCDSFSIFEFIFGPKLKRHPGKSGKVLEPSKAESVVLSFGYPFESHEVISENGYVLHLHRIPKSNKRKTTHLPRPVAFLQHGFLASSDSWLFRGPERDLPYVMADAGYDVWLGNTRGNSYSRKHKHLDPDKDADYWKFGMHEMGYFDLPAMIDYVLNVTKQENLYYIGHSMGSSIMFIMCSQRPEYNSKIRLHLGLGPLAYVSHKFSPVHKLVFKLIPSITQMILTENIYELLPRRASITKITELLCRDEMPTQKLCLSLMFLIVGIDYKQFNNTMIPTAFSYYPAGTSTLAAVHVAQLFLSRDFSSLDFGDNKMNLIKYNNTHPISYNLSLVTVPTSLHYGKGDFLVTEKDVERLAETLPNIVGKFEVPYSSFNHLDFMWATDSKILLYDLLVKLMKKHR